MLVFSILIPIHNRLPVTQKGLSALYKALGHYQRQGKSGCRFEVIVIDDGSRDGSSAWIAENYPMIHLLSGDGNLWWSGAVNLGADFAMNQLNSDYLLLWNDDITPHEDYFCLVEDLYTSLPLDNTIVGSKIVSHEDHDRTWSLGGYFNRLTGSHGQYSKEGAEINTDFFECDWEPGMGTLVPISVMRTHHLRWDAKVFPQYHGDSDFTLRCKSKGVRIVTCLRLVIYNKTDMTGIGRIDSFRKLYTSLTSIRSSSHIGKRLRFYRRHGIFPFAYLGFLRTYALYIGGFLKRKLIKTT